MAREGRGAGKSTTPRGHHEKECLGKKLHQIRIGVRKTVRCGPSYACLGRVRLPQDGVVRRTAG